MDSMFLNLVRGNRLTAYMGLEMSEGHVYKFSKDYTYIEIPLLEARNGGEKVKDKALRNQHIELVPACRVKLHGSYKLLVKTNPDLQAIGNAPTVFMVEEEIGHPSFYITLRKDLDLSKLEWAVRLYLVT